MHPLGHATTKGPTVDVWRPGKTLHHSTCNLYVINGDFASNCGRIIQPDGDWTRFIHFCAVVNNYICTLPEVACDVISSAIVSPIVPDNAVKFGDPGLGSQEIRLSSRR